MRKTLNISEKTYERLKTFGEFGEKFEDVLNKLMDEVEGK